MKDTRRREDLSGIYEGMVARYSLFPPFPPFWRVTTLSEKDTRLLMAKLREICRKSKLSVAGAFPSHSLTYNTLFTLFQGGTLLDFSRNRRNSSSLSFLEAGIFILGASHSLVVHGERRKNYVENSWKFRWNSPEICRSSDFFGFMREGNPDPRGLENTLNCA